jgi:CheY-like chemotaxis protein
MWWSRKKAKILLVDDEPDLLRLLQMELEAQRYEVVTAAGGEEALELVEVARPDLIVMDVLMPQMSGIQACQRLKGDPATRHIPIVYLTARSGASIDAEHVPYRPDFVVNKPFDRRRLLNVIEKALAQHR